MALTGSAQTEQARLAALVEHVEDLVAAGTTSEAEIPGDRLREAVRLCGQLDSGILPVALLFAASAPLDRRRVIPFLTRLPMTLPESAVAALNHVSETMLMITDTDLQASGTIVASIFVLRALPDDLTARDRILESLLVLTEAQRETRATRHGPIFGLLAQVRERPTLNALPGLLSQISEALEDIACEKDVFLDDPVQLIPKRPIAAKSAMETFKDARVASGADIPKLSDELERIEALQDVLGWSRDRALTLVTDLYQRKVMDSRAKLGLSVAALCEVVADVQKTLDSEVKDIKVEEQRTGQLFSYDWDSGDFVLYMGHHGSLTSRAIREARDGILERLTQEKLDRETSALEKAVDRYQKARAARGGDLVPEEGEVAAMAAFAECLGISLEHAYDTTATLYGAPGIPFTGSNKTGLSIEALTETVRAIAEPGTISAIAVDAEVDGRIPYSVNKEDGVLKLHSSFVGLSTSTLRRCTKERSIEALPLTEPDAERLPEYRDPDEPGSVSDERNVKSLIEEFKLAEEHAVDSFEVMLEGCPGLSEAVSIQAIRVLVATVNTRLGPDSSIDLVTGFSREIPGTKKEDYASVAWLAEDTEEDTPLNMLTLNFSYGEGKQKLPPFSDELLLDWCRHYIPK